MGGDAALISSVIGMVSSGLTKMSSKKQPQGQVDNSAQLAEERREKQAEQARKEADERRRKREKVIEARQLEKSRMASASSRRTSLSQRGAGLTGSASTDSASLKNKLGE